MNFNKIFNKDFSIKRFFKRFFYNNLSLYVLIKLHLFLFFSCIFIPFYDILIMVIVLYNLIMMVKAVHLLWVLK